MNTALDSKNLTREERTQLILTRIENVVLSIVDSLYNKNKLTINKINLPKWSNWKYDGKMLANTKTLNIKTKKNRTYFTVIVYILSKIYKNLMFKKSCTTRGLFYSDTVLFKNVDVVRRALIDICWLLGTKSWELGITLTSHGLVAGNLTIYMCNGNILDCSKTIEGIQLPQDVLEIDKFKSSAKYILIIEKNSIFQRIINEGLLKTNEYLIITGKGFPDIITRLFVKQLSNKLNIPILALVDGNPFGIEIMCVYRFGSNSMIHQNEMLSVSSIKWLGVHSSDIELLNLPSTPLTSLDQNRVQSLLKRTYISSNNELLHQVLLMHQLNRKAEIESLTTFTHNYLTEVYIKNKIMYQQFI